MTQHTPGPWKFDGSREYHSEDVIRHKHGVVVAIIPTDFYRIARMANARLIAAAPELLGALEAMLRGADLVMAETLDGGNPFPTLAHAAQKAQAAIAKAEA